MSSFVRVVLSVNWRSCRLLYRSLEFFDLNSSVREFHFWHFSLLSFLSHGQKLCHTRTRHRSHIFRHEERTCPDKIRRRTWHSLRSDNDGVSISNPNCYMAMAARHRLHREAASTVVSITDAN